MRITFLTAGRPLPGGPHQRAGAALVAWMSGRAVPANHVVAAVREIVRETTGIDPRELRFLSTDRGLVAFLTLAMAPERALAEAHASASEVEERIRRDHPEIVDVIVHTEP